MDKSYNDIKAQEQRVITTATEIGRYCDNKTGCVDIQRIAQITRNTLCQHGIGFFGYDPNEKKPRKMIERQKAEPDRQRLDEKRAAGAEKQTPTQKAESRIALADWMAADEANRKKIADIARHQFIKKMYAELLDYVDESYIDDVEGCADGIKKAATDLRDIAEFATPAKG